jgi:peptidoglycan/LPS O-acetylase OafA/YrhL
MDVLRLGAATLVIVTHSYALTNSASRASADEFGDLASSSSRSAGFWSPPLASDPRPHSFVLRRGLRILPGLWVVLLLSTFVMGMVVRSCR